MRWISWSYLTARNAMSMLCELKKTLEMEGLMTPARHEVFVNMFLAVGMEMERILTIEVPEGFDSRRRVKQAGNGLEAEML